MKQRLVLKPTLSIRQECKKHVLCGDCYKSRTGAPPCARSRHTGYTISGIPTGKPPEKKSLEDHTTF